MAKDITKITDNINKVTQDVYNYIVETPHYIFYWLWKDEVRNFIKDNPDYEDKITISVVFISSSYLGETSAYVDINLYDGFKVETLHSMWCNISAFRSEAIAHWEKSNGKLTEQRIQELEQARDTIRQELAKTEEKIKKLKNSIKPNENDIQ